MTRIDEKSTWLKRRLDMQDKLQAGGVWSPEQEHDACGVGMIAAIDGTASRQVVEKLSRHCRRSGIVELLMQMGKPVTEQVSIWKSRVTFLPSILNIPVMWLMMAVSGLVWYFCREQIWPRRKHAAVLLKMKFWLPVSVFMAGGRFLLIYRL